MAKRIMFTGGSGKAGRHAIQHLVEHGYQVLNLDTKPLDNPKVRTLITDITDAGQVFNALSSTFAMHEFDPSLAPQPVDAVVHYAAIPRIMITPDNELFRINVIGTYNVIDAAVKLGIRKIVIASSETTYGIVFADEPREPDYLPLDEDYDVNPMDSYALSKVLNEKTARAFALRSGADIYALRIGNVIEPHEYELFPKWFADPGFRMAARWRRFSIGGRKEYSGPMLTKPDRTTPETIAARVAVSVHHVSMTYSAVCAVDDASFDLAEGAFLTILGPSGSGKTTLLRMIAGFQQPTGGEILMQGKPVRAVPPHKRAIGMVFQRLALFPHMSAAENLGFPLKMRRFDARTIPERVQRYLEIVRLGGLGARRVHELSGGQQQRVAIARALVFEPDLLLLDEPLASLDRKLREEMQIEFRRIQRELGVTTINVTHDQREALVMSDEIIVMDKGRIQQKARPTETYREPTNPFVAGFIGVTNFFAGTIASERDGAVALNVNGVELSGRIAAGAPAQRSGAPATAALRAEQIRLARSAAELGRLDTIHEGSIADVIFEGERIVYEVRIGSLEDQAVRVFSHDPALLAEFEHGSRVFLGWNSRDLLVYSNGDITRTEGE